MLPCAFVAEFVDAQVVKTLGFLGVVGSSPTARAVLRLRAVAEQTQIGRCPLLACAFVAEFVDAQVVKTLGFLGIVGSSPTARAVLRLRAVAEQTQIGRCPLCWHVPSLPSLSTPRLLRHLASWG